MAPAIPDRWLDYTPVGHAVEGTRFVAFKVPLNPIINESVAPNNRLDINVLLAAVPNLGLVIDLTNTQRYYKPEIFISEGIQHKKINVPGHVTPPQALTEIFNEACTSFLENNKDNDKLIGVHCTHGVNRTGYFICQYMISQLGMKPVDAIQNFSRARGHHIERKNYLAALHTFNEKHQSNFNAAPSPSQSDVKSSWCRGRRHEVTNYDNNKTSKMAKEEPISWRDRRTDNSTDSWNASRSSNASVGDLTDWRAQCYPRKNTLNQHFNQRHLATDAGSSNWRELQYPQQQTQTDQQHYQRSYVFNNSNFGKVPNARRNPFRSGPLGTDFGVGQATESKKTGFD